MRLHTGRADDGKAIWKAILVARVPDLSCPPQHAILYHPMLMNDCDLGVNQYGMDVLLMLE